MAAAHRSATLASTLADRMTELGLDQRALAARSGVAAATIRELQHGIRRDYRPSTLAKLSRALEWPPEALIRLLSSIEDATPVRRSVDPSYERPALVEINVLDRLTEMEAELHVLRQLVAHSIATGDGPTGRG